MATDFQLHVNKENNWWCVSRVFTWRNNFYRPSHHQNLNANLWVRTNPLAGQNSENIIVELQHVCFCICSVSVSSKKLRLVYSSHIKWVKNTQIWKSDTLMPPISKSYMTKNDYYMKIGVIIETLMPPIFIYRSGMVNLKSFVGKVLLRIKRKFELN